MTTRKSYRPYLTGVSFHPEVVEYLDALKVEEDLDRSTLLNRIVREHARRRRSGGLQPVAPKGRILAVKPVIG